MMHIDAHCAPRVTVQSTCTCTYPFRDVQYVHPNECIRSDNQKGRRGSDTAQTSQSARGWPV
jgi:hypothetical protein